MKGQAINIKIGRNGKAAVIFAVLAVMVTLFSGCITKVGRVYILENSTNEEKHFSDFVKIIDMQENCPGLIKGYIAGENTFLAAQKKEKGYAVMKCAAYNKKPDETIYETAESGVPKMITSRYTKKVIVNDVLIDLENEQGEEEIVRLREYNPSYKNFSEYFPYVFLTRAEPVNIDFLYYTDVVNNAVSLSEDAEEGKKILETLERCFFPGSNPDVILNLSPIIQHDINFKNQKYFFISAADNALGTTGDLYCYDFYTKALKKLDEDVKMFKVLTENDSIAYVKKETNDSLVIQDVVKDEKKVLATFSDISGMQFSPKGNWIAFSAGESNKNDIYMVSYDGALMEQLTHGYNTFGEMFWSEDGFKISFNSLRNPSMDMNPKIYTIYLNILEEIEVSHNEDAKDIYKRQEQAEELYNVLSKATQEMKDRL